MIGARMVELKSRPRPKRVTQEEASYTRELARLRERVASAQSSLVHAKWALERGALTPEMLQVVVELLRGGP